MINNIHDNLIIKTIMPVVEKYNEHAYIVGGFLRDTLLSVENCDVDIVVNKGHAKKFAQNLANEIGGYFVELDTINNIYRVVFDDKTNYIDIADCTGKTIEDDLKRRDFTINALAYDLKNNMLIDILNSVNDIENKIIREISKDNMLDDPVRLFRAFRFQSQLSFEFSQNLSTIIKENTACLKTVAKERINVELIKLFGGKNIINTLKSLDNYGVLSMIFPEIDDIKKIPPNSHHHLNLFDHCIETVKQVDCYLENACDEVKSHLHSNFFGGVKRINYLKLGAFLHDIGKPCTWKIEPDTKRHRFIMHDSEGAKLIAPRLKELKFSKKQIIYIQKLIKNHIYPASVVTSEDVNEKAFLRFYRKMENETIDLIVLAYADRMSALGPDITEEITQKNINGLEKLLNGYLQERNKLAPLPKLIDGKEIMEILKIEASPMLGKIINELKEAQISGEINSREEAIEYIKTIKIS